MDSNINTNEVKKIKLKWSDPNYRKEYFKNYWLTKCKKPDAKSRIRTDIPLTEEQIKQRTYHYNKQWKNKTYLCPFCNIEIKNGSKYSHSKSEGHRVNILKHKGVEQKIIDMII